MQDHQKDLFEIAVYRVPPEKWGEDTEARVKELADRHLEDMERAGASIDSQQRFRAQQSAEYVERPHRWQYNEVVAWVRLIWDGPGPVVKAYLSQVGKKSFEGGRPRHHYQRGFIPYPFVHGEPMSKSFETWFTNETPDTEIYLRIRERLCAITSRGGDLPGRHVDLRVFDAIGPHVRWQEVMTPS